MTASTTPPVLAVAVSHGHDRRTSTAASESAQVVIMNDDIASVPRAIAIARRTKKVMLQAVLIGLGLAIIGMIAAAFNLIPVVVGAFMRKRLRLSAFCGRSPCFSTVANQPDCASKPRISPIYGRFGGLSASISLISGRSI